MDDVDSDWQRKGATLSDKTARKDYGLTEDAWPKAVAFLKQHTKWLIDKGTKWV